MSNQSSVCVLGAGIVGICCALELQRKGYQVMLVDRHGPGQETSSGNAGLLSYGSITPLADPALLSRLHRLLLNLDDDVLIHYPQLMALMPWLARFLLRCRRKTYLLDGNAMNDLTTASVELHKRWIDDAGAQQLVNPLGSLKLYRHQQSFLRAKLERELLQACGVKTTLLSAEQAYQMEPSLKPIFCRAVLIDETISIRNPATLCRAYAGLFTAAGGLIERAAVHSVRPVSDGWEVNSDQAPFVTTKLVICLGAWTPEIIGPLGYANPLAIERGYHTIVSTTGQHELTRAIFDVDASYVISPMEMGLRITTGSNLTRRETQPDPRQVARVLPRAREAFAIDEVLLEQPWMGRRPTVPDTVPIIGPAPRHQNLWLAFAHAHMGLTLGPISGVLIANFISGATQPISPNTCDPARYL